MRIQMLPTIGAQLVKTSTFHSIKKKLSAANYMILRQVQIGQQHLLHGISCAKVYTMFKNQYEILVLAILLKKDNMITDISMYTYKVHTSEMNASSILFEKLATMLEKHRNCFDKKNDCISCSLMLVWLSYSY
jgi:hypothetical protein